MTEERRRKERVCRSWKVKGQGSRVKEQRERVGGGIVDTDEDVWKLKNRNNNE